MRPTNRSLRSIVLATVCVGLSVAPSWGGHKKETPTIPPVDELEILDPEVDPEGKPRSVLVPGPDGQPRLEVPPTVIVHRHYYTGDRDFQGPFLQGGPVLVVVRHPVTGEQTYIELQLPPGAPRIYYRKSHIVYQYRDENVVLKFGSSGWLGQLGKPAISLHHRSSLVRHVEAHHEAKKEKHQAWLDRAGIPDAVACARECAGKTGETTAKVVRVTGDIVTVPIDFVRDSTPLGVFLGQER